MHERDFEARRDNDKADLESRLAAYYGPDLREQPLPQTEWLRLRAKLGHRHTAKGRHVRRILLRRNARSNRVPAYIQDTFSRIIYEAHMQSDTPGLRCSFKSTLHMPEVHTSFLGERKIWLILPSYGAGSMETAMLEVLLAMGLARYSYSRRLENRLLRVFLVATVILMLVTFILWLAYQYSLLAFLIAIILFVIVAALVSIQRRRRVFQADELMVRWLGRSRVCRGLHLLAGQGDKQRRVFLWEPSLAERIGRVCGTQVETESQRLTLVR